MQNVLSSPWLCHFFHQLFHALVFERLDVCSFLSAPQRVALPHDVNYSHVGRLRGYLQLKKEKKRKEKKMYDKDTTHDKYKYLVSKCDLPLPKASTLSIKSRLFSRLKSFTRYL